MKIAIRCLSSTLTLQKIAMNDGGQNIGCVLDFWCTTNCVITCIFGAYHTQKHFDNLFGGNPVNITIRRLSFSTLTLQNIAMNDGGQNIGYVYVLYVWCFYHQWCFHQKPSDIRGNLFLVAMDPGMIAIRHRLFPLLSCKHCYDVWPYLALCFWCYYL